MDALLSKLGSHAVNYAIRSGIAITSTYAVNQCSRLLKTVDDKGVYTELKKLQKLLDSKIKIVSPAIDLIEFKSGRGNVFLEAAVPLAKSLHRDIISLGKRLNDAATAEESSRSDGQKARMSEAHHVELLTVIKEMKELLARIDREIPLIQLAITASGERMNTTVNAGISPSRLMQASAFLSFGDSHFVNNPNRAVPIGPSFTLSLYMLFRGHSRLKSASSVPATPSTGGKTRWTKEQPYGVGEGERKPIWQEVVHKARVRLVRTPLGWKFDKPRGYCPGESSDGTVNGYSAAVDSALSMLGRPDEYAYHLEIIEDLDDGRVHDDDAAGEPFDGIDMAGIRDSIPIHQVSKIFYTDTGRLLNIGNADEGDNNPVLLLKRDLHAPDPIELKRQWYADPEQAEASEGETAYDTAEDDEQAGIDAQLLAEAKSTELAAAAEEGRLRKALGLPSHLDPEWLALEVFVESDDESDDDDDDGDDKSSIQSAKSATPRDKVVDSKLIDQIRNVSLQPYPNTPPKQRKYVPSPLSSTTSLAAGGANGKQLFQTPTQVQGAQKEPNSMDSFVARSPFGAITSSLSLMEMLIRLCSLQEFQQTSHLSIPDHILTFFLEETSTTGLRGEEKWDIRNEAKRRMGFDPYTDTPTKST